MRVSSGTWLTGSAPKRTELKTSAGTSLDSDHCRRISGDSVFPRWRSAPRI
jgi:hypothetical protein